MVVMAAQQCECTSCHLNVHLKMAKIVHLYFVYFTILKNKKCWGELRWQWSRYKLHSPLPRFNLELQLNHKAINTHNQLNMSWTEVLELTIYKRSHIETGGKGEDGKRADSIPMCGNWENWEGYLSCGDPPWGAWGSNPAGLEPGAPQLGRGSHITSGCEKQQDSDHERESGVY